MRGTKTITFDKPFLYSRGGTFEEATEITVRAPGMTLIRVHARVESAVARAILAFPRPEKREEQTDDEHEEAVTEAGKAEIDALQVLAAGLGADDYGDTLVWLKKTLTNQPRLATITGTDNLAITDEVWDSIEEESGTDAALKVLSAFVGFFLERLNKEPPKPNGAAASAGSASVTKVH